MRAHGGCATIFAKLPLCEAVEMKDRSTHHPKGTYLQRLFMCFLCDVVKVKDGGTYHPKGTHLCWLFKCVHTLMKWQKPYPVVQETNLTGGDSLDQFQKES